jgi:hypothetical protein
MQADTYLSIGRQVSRPDGLRQTRGKNVLVLNSLVRFTTRSDEVMPNTQTDLEKIFTVACIRLPYLLLNLSYFANTCTERLAVLLSCCLS